MNLSISTHDDIQASRKFLLEKGNEHYRNLPWRGEISPWHILISEVMLQQTQVSRVVQIFSRWREDFPYPSSLASISISEVLSAWSGLGYNRRALALHQTAKILAEAYSDAVPASELELRSLPGIGQYTSRAILAFAFDIPTVFLETNIRSVYIRHFFDDVALVEDRQLEDIGEVLLDREHPRSWYTALMDYGAWLKAHEENYARKSLTFRSQTTFKGSERQLRGAILKSLLASSPQTLSALAAQVQSNETRVWICAEKLEKEGFVKTFASGGVERSLSNLSTNLISLADHKS